MTRTYAGNKEEDVIKKLSRLHLHDIAETKKRLGQRELSEAKLKLVSGGGGGLGAVDSNLSDGGTCTDCGDSDC